MEPNVASQKVTDPIFAQVKAAMKDPAKPFTLLFRLQVRKGREKRSRMPSPRPTRPPT
jgi:hypothetical protein